MTAVRGPGVTVARLASFAGDQIPVSICTTVTGLACDVGQTRACAIVRVTEASFLTRGTLSGIHPGRMAGAPWDKRAIATGKFRDDTGIQQTIQTLYVSFLQRAQGRDT